MKQNFLCILLMSLFFHVTAQDKQLGIQLSPGITVAHVKDERPEPSGGLDPAGYLVNPADGETTNAGNQTGLGATFFYEVGINDKVALSTGIGIVQKYIYIANRDASYYGVSKYGITYLQIPLAFKIYLADPAPNFKLYTKLGLSLDLKAREKVDGPDYAHYWNMAKNNVYIDNIRGKNAEYREKNLFAPLNLGVFAGLGGEFKLDNIILSLGFSYNVGLFNTLNRDLKHDDWNRTPITDGLSIRTDLFAVDLGIGFLLK